MVVQLNHPKIRLLHCRPCGTIETLPDYEGPVERDAALTYLSTKHMVGDHALKLYDVEQRVWDLDNLRQSIIRQLKGGSAGLAELDPHFYDTRDTLREDALSCYQVHLRPKEGCYDWRIDRKLLIPPTRADRKDVGLSMEGAPKRWLCDYCPVRAHYERRSRGD